MLKALWHLPKVSSVFNVALQIKIIICFLPLLFTVLKGPRPRPCCFESKLDYNVSTNKSLFVIKRDCQCNLRRFVVVIFQLWDSADWRHKKERFRQVPHADTLSGCSQVSSFFFSCIIGFLLIISNNNNNQFLYSTFS